MKIAKDMLLIITKDKKREFIAGSTRRRK